MKYIIWIVWTLSTLLAGCSEMEFADVQKEDTLAKTSVFGRQSAGPVTDGANGTAGLPGADTQVDGSIPTAGSDTPIDGSVPTTGNGSPTDGSIPTGGSGSPIIGGIPTGTGGLPIPGSLPTGSTDPVYESFPINTNNDALDFTFTCPNKVHHVEKTFLQAGEVKVVFADNSGKSICEVHNARQQIISKKEVDISTCKDAIKSQNTVSVYVVEESVTDNIDAHKLQTFAATYSHNMGSSMPIELVYTYDDDKNNVGACGWRVGDPLLIQLNTSKAQPISLTDASNGVMFDLLGSRNNHQKVKTAWFTSANTENYFLVLPDENGDVHGIDELFGDSTLGPDRRFAKQGFAALAKYDLNHDRNIDANDEVFAKLALWKDDNLDGVAQASEIYSLDEKGIVSIDLRFDRRFKEVDAHGNMTKFKSVVKMKDKSYSLIYDLWLRYSK